MTLTIERAKAVIAGLERLRERATRGLWESVNDYQRVCLGKESYTLGYQSVRANGHNIIRFVSSEEGIGNALLIVTLVNGFDGIVGPIRANIAILVRLLGAPDKNTSIEITIDDLRAIIATWCDLWEPLLKLGEGRK